MLKLSLNYNELTNLEKRFLATKEQTAKNTLDKLLKLGYSQDQIKNIERNLL